MWGRDTILAMRCLPNWCADYGAGKPKTRFQGDVMEAELGGQRALLLSPTTFMNLSGASVLECEIFISCKRRTC